MFLFQEFCSNWRITLFTVLLPNITCVSFHFHSFPSHTPLRSISLNHITCHSRPLPRVFLYLYILTRIPSECVHTAMVSLWSTPRGSCGPPIIPLELVGEPKLYLGGWCSYASDIIGVCVFVCVCVCVCVRVCMLPGRVDLFAPEYIESIAVGARALLRGNVPRDILSVFSKSPSFWVLEFVLEVL